MKTLRYRKHLATLGLALGCAAFTGCFSNSGSNNDDDNSASIRGEIQGDVEASGSGSGGDSSWQGTIVTTHTISATGALSAAIDSGTADANGRFNIETDLRGHQELILRAQRGSNEWMARFEGTIENNQTEDSRPLNLESTLESKVLVELKGTEEGRQVHSSDVNLAIDANVAASSRGEYRGTETQRNLLITRLAASVKAASRARNAYLTLADSLYVSHKSRIDSARVNAEAQFQASLYAAAHDTANARAAERSYLNAIVKAYVAADVERTDYARSTEASYQAALRASVLISDSARTRFARNYARILVIASDTAMRHEFRHAGSSEARVSLVTAAGARFKTSVDTAGSRARLDSAVVRFRADLRAAFDDSTGNDTADFNLFGNVASTLNITNLFASLTASLHAVLIGSSTDGEDVGEAYADAQLDAKADLRAAIDAQTDDGDKAGAAASLLAYINVHSSSN